MAQQPASDAAAQFRSILDDADLLSECDDLMLGHDDLLESMQTGQVRSTWAARRSRVSQLDP